MAPSESRVAGPREPDWAAARDALDEMIGEAGGITDEARAWAREALVGDPRVTPGSG